MTGDRRIAVANIGAGLAVAGLLLPEAVAYAGIAGLPPDQGLIAAVSGGLGYLAVGRSRFAIVAPTSAAAALLAAAIGSLDIAAVDRPVVAMAAALFVGIAFGAIAIFRLAGATDFIAMPVLKGFGFGLAATITIRQLPALTGVTASEDTVFALLLAWSRALPTMAWQSPAIGIGALLALLALRRWATVPASALVLAAGILLAYLLDLGGAGVALVGPVTVAPHMPVSPGLSRDQWFQLARATAPLVLILAAESWGTIRGLALAHGDTIAPEREFAGLSIANLAAAIGGMPVGAGFTAGNANATAGGNGRGAGVAAVVALVAAVELAAPLVAYIPRPLLAAVVIAAVAHALDPGPLLRLRSFPTDFWVALAAAAGVLVLGVLNGMLVAVALSLVLLLRRLARPELQELGAFGDHDFVALSHNPMARAVVGIAIFRPAGPLFFANATRVLDAVAASGSRPGTSSIVVSLEESDDLDAAACDALAQLDRQLRGRGQSLWLARVHDRVCAHLAAVDLSALVPPASHSVADVVAAIRSRT